MAYGRGPRPPPYWGTTAERKDPPRGGDADRGSSEREVARPPKGEVLGDLIQPEGGHREVSGHGRRLFRPAAGYVRRGATAGDHPGRLVVAGEQSSHASARRSRPGWRGRVDPRRGRSGTPYFFCIPPSGSPSTARTKEAGVPGVGPRPEFIGAALKAGDRVPLVAILLFVTRAEGVPVAEMIGQRRLGHLLGLLRRRTRLVA